jgi:hypothetical protein
LRNACFSTARTLETPRARAGHSRQNGRQWRAERHRRQHELGQRASPGDWQPAELDGENNREQRSEPEIRHRDPDQCERRGDVIDEGAGADRRDHAKRNRDDDGDEHGRRRQFEGRRQTVHDRGRHGLARSQRCSQVPVGRGVQKRDVLSVERSIQPKPRAKLVDALRRSAIAEHRLDGIARDDMNQGEDECRNTQEHWNRQQNAADQEAQHAGQS